MAKTKVKKRKKTAFLKSAEWKQLRSEHLAEEPCCVLCGSQQGLQVHHILYRKFYKLHQLQKWNLVTVCVKCHWKLHKSSYNFKLAEWLCAHRPDDYYEVMKNI